MEGKAFNYKLYQNWTHNQLCFMEALILVKQIALSFTYHVNLE
jgi:hypothetical protein